MRVELKKLHDRLGTTAIYVTHDQVEAMTLGDRVVVMQDGLVQQVGEPLELYNEPANRFVAGFLGSPAMNFAAVVVRETDGALWAEDDGIRIKVPGQTAGASASLCRRAGDVRDPPRGFARRTPKPSARPGLSPVVGHRASMAQQKAMGFAEPVIAPARDPIALARWGCLASGRTRWLNPSLRFSNVSRAILSRICCPAYNAKHASTSQPSRPQRQAT